jgi:hypothetical protein
LRKPQTEGGFEVYGGFVELIQFDARFLDFAPVLSGENTGASLEMTRVLGITQVESGFER